MKPFLYIMALGSLLGCISCNSENDYLEPSNNYSVLRLQFPQGNNDFDYEIKDIHDKYGVYLIYKDVTLADLNRTWTSIGTGYTYYGDPLKDEDVPFYVNFLHKHVLNYIDPQIAQAAFPVKIYMMSNFRAIPFGEEDQPYPDPDGGGTGGTGTGGTGTGGTGTGGTGTGGTGTGGTGTGGTGTGGTGTGGTGIGGTGTGGTGTGGTGIGGTGTGGTGTGGTGTGGTGTGGTGTGGTGGTGTGGTGTGGTGTGGTGTGTDPLDNMVSPKFQATKLDGFDYWAISFKPSDIKYSTKESLKIRRCTFLYAMIKKAKANGLFVEPENMKEGISFESFRPNTAETRHSRGFINRVYEDFGSKGDVEYTGTDYASYYTNGTQDYFLCYVRAAMYYTRDEFYAKYPADKYPLIAEKYELVVSVMKNKYGVDLQGIAEGPEQ